MSADVTLAVITRGQTQTGHGSGFVPGEVVSGTQQSAPLTLGTQVADANGDVTFTWTIRPDETLGTHSFIVAGAESGTASATFRVVADGTLPATGNQTSSMFGKALVVFVVGVFLVAATAQFRTARRSR